MRSGSRLSLNKILHINLNYIQYKLLCNKSETFCLACLTFLESFSMMTCEQLWVKNDPASFSRKGRSQAVVAAFGFVDRQQRLLSLLNEALKRCLVCFLVPDPVDSSNLRVDTAVEEAKLFLNRREIYHICLGPWLTSGLSRSCGKCRAHANGTELESFPAMPVIKT